MEKSITTPEKKGTKRGRSKSPSSSPPTKRQKKTVVASSSSDFTLPDGWKMHTKVRQSGATVGREDKYYEAPDGSVYRSKREVQRALKKNKSKK